jgi:hypothetical protein
VFSGLLACSSPASVPPTPANKPSETSVVPSPSGNPSTSPVKLDVLYFHRPQRCASCLCFEERVNYVVNEYFKNELSSGKLTFAILDVTETKNSALVKKYGAVGTQLFINIIINGTETIKDIQEIWDWGCLKDKAAFDKKVKDIIDLGLKGKI